MARKTSECVEIIDRFMISGKLIVCSLSTNEKAAHWVVPRPSLHGFLVRAALTPMHDIQAGEVGVMRRVGSRSRNGKGRGKVEGASSVLLRYCIFVYVSVNACYSTSRALWGMI